MNGMSMKGKTALVTGASRGIGRAAARSLADLGANVILTARTQDAADAAAEKISGAMGFAAHAADEDASKAALIQLTRQSAVELAPTVRVNAVAPGVVRTKLSELLWRDHEQTLVDSVPLARIGEPEDVGWAIAFLASDAAAWITGQTLVIDGGAIL
jgi:NAD(P)-dependent dehydrogenase (short-subunit alcohol dehydrogenase family)